MWGDTSGHTIGQGKVGFRHTCFQSASQAGPLHPCRREATQRGGAVGGKSSMKNTQKNCLYWQTQTLLPFSLCSLKALPFSPWFAQGRGIRARGGAEAGQTLVQLPSLQTVPITVKPHLGGCWDVVGRKVCVPAHVGSF